MSDFATELQKRLVSLQEELETLSQLADQLPEPIKSEIKSDLMTTGIW